MQERDVVIVGSGPAGSATAAALAQADPAVAAATLVLERAHHPRPKLCGGGVTHRGERVLRRLELAADVPSVWIDRVQFWFDDEPLTVERPGRLRIVRRDEFDAALVAGVRERGVEVREGERVVALRRAGDRIAVETEADTYLARVVVGADGAKGPVRSTFVPEEQSRVSRLVEVLVESDAAAPEHRDRMAVFDFRPMKRDLQGYTWDFPCLVAGRPTLNVGGFDSRRNDGSRAPLKELVTERLAARGVDPTRVRLQGHPERWYAPSGTYAAPNVVLAGDAAGIEPLLGEGIAYALEYGPVTAAAIVDALRTGDLSFADYGDRLRASRLGSALNRNQRAAWVFYRPFLRGLAPPLVRLLVRRMRRRGELRTLRAQEVARAGGE